MKLQDALDAVGSKHERDSIESIAVTKTRNTNFSLSNVRVGITTKRHPMPYDPGNFSFSYSHSHRNTRGETTVYENEDNWRGTMNYSYTPVYKTFEPFKKLLAKSKGKWLEIFKRFGLNWLPQNISFNSEITRNYYELQERDMESLENSQLPLTFSEQFLWSREFSVRWDLTKNLHLNFNSATNAQIEEPYTPVNKDLYPNQYEAWKDSVKTSLQHLGTPLDYSQNFTASYQLPLNLIPMFDWVNADANYTATYHWLRGTDLEDGTSLGNTISNNRQVSVNGSFNLERLYNHIPFLKKTNDRFRNSTSSISSRNDRKKIGDRGDTGNMRKKARADKEKEKEQKALPKNKKSFEKEITLNPDTVMTVNHGKNSKNVSVTARTSDGKVFKVKYKVVDLNTIKITSKVDTATTVKLTVVARQPDEEKAWYKTAQVVTRGLMMVRNVSFSYRNQYSMSLPGFLPQVGDMFGQRRGHVLAPGLDFAFGLTGDSYIDKAAENHWLLMADSIATPSTASSTNDLQLRMTLEPANNLKIDLNASRTDNRAKSVQFMYQGMPTTHSGTFTMTTISIKSALEGMGNASNGYRSPSFENFCRSLEGFRNRVEEQYRGVTYPNGSALAGRTFDAANGGVNLYSADVMIPAFLANYTTMGGNGLNIFPTLAKLLPNWSMRYGGLGRLPWFRDHFKSVNINHGYKSVFAIGSYSTYSTFMEYMNGLGFVSDATTGNPVPNSMYNVSNVSINEAFSPLLGVDMTFQNNLTAKLEYRTMRVLNLSMTSVQISESISRDWVVGMGYKINDFKLFGGNKGKKAKGNVKKDGSPQQESSQSTRNMQRNGVNHDLNLRLDLSYRNQAAIVRDIASMTSSASSGNKAFKLSFSADYTLSRLLTLQFYYDRQSNTPLLSSSSYPTTTRDFGFSLKFSLTR